MPKTLTKLRAEHIERLYAQARAHIRNAMLLEAHGPSVVAKMERQEARAIIKALKAIPAITMLPKDRT